jgi:hypothetical protein
MDGHSKRTVMAHRWSCLTQMATRAIRELAGQCGSRRFPGTGPVTDVENTVQLNEVMTRNVNAVLNGGAHPAWIELHTLASLADVSGWRFSNDDNPTKFVFRQGPSSRQAISSFV